MSTERLYYADPSLLAFEAVVQSSLQKDSGWHTTLDKTAFYPTSGGQLFDVGKINGVDIVDVAESENGNVVHISRIPVGSSGDIALGLVDSGRRRMHRQQHTAQHILSYAFVKLFSVETVSVHLGEEYGAVELDATTVSPEQLAAAELLTRDVVAENSSIDILMVNSEEAAKLPLRKATSREGTIRVIRIGDYDWSACGGTHCSQTAEVGSFVISGSSKMRGRTLVTFLAGDQLLADYSQRKLVTTKLSEQFTCSVSDLPANVSKIVDDSRDLRKQIEQMGKELLPYKADKAASLAIKVGLYKAYIAIEDNMEPKMLSAYSAAVADKISGVVVIISGGRAVISCVANCGCKASDLARAIASATGGKGGGNDTGAQIGNIPAEKITEVKSIVEEFLSRA